MRTPLYDAVTKYEPRARFHMPAHFADEKLCPLYFCSRYDITELSFSDNLQAPEGIIKEAEELAAKAFKCDRALYITSGATTAIQIALKSAQAENILILGEAHKSVYEAVRLYNLKAYVCKTFELAKRCVKENKIDTLFFTSPDYFGRVIKYEEIHRFAKENNLVLIADSAHGAHFPFCSKLPVSATEYADLVIHSCHKTLPVYTGGAVLSVGERFFERALFYRGAIHSTSPSYLILASLDYARGYFNEYGETLFSKLKSNVERFIKETKNEKYYFYYNDDPVHLILHLNGLSGQNLNAELEKRNIFSETYSGSEILFLVTPLNADKLVILAKELQNIEMVPLTDDKEKFPDKNETHIIYSAPFSLVRLSEAEGRTLYREVGLYPPGTPLFYQGDILRAEDISFLNFNRERLFGLVNGYISVLQ